MMIMIIVTIMMIDHDNDNDYVDDDVGTVPALLEEHARNPEISGVVVMMMMMMMR